MEPTSNTPPAPEAPETAPQGDSLRAAVEAAYEKSESAAPPEGAPAVKPGPAPQALAGPAARDPETGKFVRTEKAGRGPQPAAPAAPSPAQAKPGAAPAPAAPGAPAPAEADAAGGDERPAPQLDRAPQSWRGTAKELWRKLPAEFAPVKAEVLRLEREREAVLRESKAARTLADSFAETVRPYEGFIRAAGHTPLQTMDGLLRTAATLRTGTDWEKALLAAGVIRAHNVNPEWVAYALQNPDALPGGAAPGPAQAEFRDPRVDQLLADAHDAREAGLAEADAQADSELDAFIASHPLAGEPDVQLRMARAVDLAEADGIDMTFEEAYGGVLAVDPELRAIAEQQDLAKAAATSPEGPTARAEAAASSVKPSPVTQAPAVKSLKGRPVEDFVRAAWDQASSRGA